MRKKNNNKKSVKMESNFFWDKLGQFATVVSAFLLYTTLVAGVVAWYYEPQIRNYEKRIHELERKVDKLEKKTKDVISEIRKTFRDIGGEVVNIKIELGQQPCFRTIRDRLETIQERASAGLKYTDDMVIGQSSYRPFQDSAYIEIVRNNLNSKISVDSVGTKRFSTDNSDAVVTLSDKKLHQENSFPSNTALPFTKLDRENTSLKKTIPPALLGTASSSTKEIFTTNQQQGQLYQYEIAKDIEAKDSLVISPVEDSKVKIMNSIFFLALNDTDGSSPINSIYRFDSRAIRWVWMAIFGKSHFYDKETHRLCGIAEIMDGNLNEAKVSAVQSLAKTIEEYLEVHGYTWADCTKEIVQYIELEEWGDSKKRYVFASIEEHDLLQILLRGDVTLLGHSENELTQNAVSQ
ncbi:MAG: hypothetical protein D6681_01575 [Calditrichaeota bacterium]|nr:MAG: hypothetical protein D6681_01575 [Calditrichota bacterium]